MKTKADRVFDVHMSEDLARMLAELSDTYNMPRTEVFRRAVGLYKICAEVDHSGGRVILDRQGARVTHLTGI